MEFRCCEADLQNSTSSLRRDNSCTEEGSVYTKSVNNVSCSVAQHRATKLEPILSVLCHVERHKNHCLCKHTISSNPLATRCINGFAYTSGTDNPGSNPAWA
jgi:hypothetical protein